MNVCVQDLIKEELAICIWLGGVLWPSQDTKNYLKSISIFTALFHTQAEVLIYEIWAFPGAISF